MSETAPLNFFFLKQGLWTSGRTCKAQIWVLHWTLFSLISNTTTYRFLSLLKSAKSSRLCQLFLSRCPGVLPTGPSPLTLMIAGWPHHQHWQGHSQHKGTGQVVSRGHRLHCWGNVCVNSLCPSDATWCQEILVNTDSGNGLVLDGTKPLPEPMLTYQLSSMEFWSFASFT